MYNNIKLDKSLYNISGKSFTQALADLDPDSAYVGTELAGLDAYERQLKRFNIRTSGENCDTVDKFFKASESAVLFPEFIRRAITSGLNDTILKDIVAVNTVCEGYDFKGYTFTDSSSYSIAINEGATFPETAITSSTNIELIKYGRTITAPYETICNQKLDLLACTLKSVGVMFANAILAKCVTTMTTGVSLVSSAVANEYSYEDLLTLQGKFTQYKLTTLLASPAVYSKLIALPEFADCVVTEDNAIQLPFGPKLYKASGYTDTQIIGFDKDFALQLITNTAGIIVECDKLISKQTNSITAALHFNVQKIIPASIVMLRYSTT